MRKMILTGALVLFGAGTTPQVVTAITVCILWFALISNLKPFGEVVDDRLAQVEALQVLFTLLIGLVLQLDAATEKNERMDDASVGIVLIGLNSIVVGLALIQQPIVRIIVTRLAQCPLRCAEKIRGKRDWEKAWIVVPSNKDYRAALRREESGEVSLELWCVASHPPRVLDAPPLALVAKRPRRSKANAWNFDGEGNVVVEPLRMTADEDGQVQWIDLATMRVLNAPPTQLFVTTLFGSAVQWLDVGTMALLHAQPGHLVFAEPEAALVDTVDSDTPLLSVWRHRMDGRLVSVDPCGPATTSADQRLSGEGWSFAAFSAANSAPRETAEAATESETHLAGANPMKLRAKGRPVQRTGTNKEQRKERMRARTAKRTEQAEAGAVRVIQARRNGGATSSERNVDMTTNPLQKEEDAVFRGAKSAVEKMLPYGFEGEMVAVDNPMQRVATASKETSAREKRIRGRAAKRTAKAEARAATRKAEAAGVPEPRQIRVTSRSR